VTFVSTINKSINSNRDFFDHFAYLRALCIKCITFG